jgi:transcriptional regulator with XRE-family HTH domain
MLIPTISDNIKTIRKHFSLSQAQFAQKIKRSPGFIANVELGRCDVSSETVKAVSSAFGINEAWLVSGTGEMFVDGCDVSEADRENVGLRIREIRTSPHNALPAKM